MDPPATYLDQKVKPKVQAFYFGLQYGERLSLARHWQAQLQLTLIWMRTCMLHMRQ